MMGNNSSLTLQYAGSVKNVFALPDEPSFLWFAFTDQYSVFDWGKMPDLIANKGRALALIGSYIFQHLKNPQTWKKLPESVYLQKFDRNYLLERFSRPIFKSLQKSGLSSHFIGLFQSNANKQLEEISLASVRDFTNIEELMMKVIAAKVYWPNAKNILHENLFFYPQSNNNECRLIPLEIIFRFGMTTGSSLKRKLETDPDYAKSLGLKSTPSLNEWFHQPTLEFSSKLEPKDRLLSRQEAASLSQLTADQFEILIELALDIALALHVLFAERGLELWDGKLEFIVNKDGQLLLADSIGPDELRLLYKGIHFSKEALRQYYRPSTWAQSLSKAQNLARERSIEDWQAICSNELKLSPKPLPAELKNVIDKLYGVLTNTLFDQPIFVKHPPLEQFALSLQKVLSSSVKEEVNA